MGGCAGSRHGRGQAFHAHGPDMASRRTAKHARIHDELAQAIASGEYVPGQKLPTEIALARHYKASRPTVAHAMQRLVTEGLVERRAGSGTYVKRSLTAGPTFFGLIVPGLGEREILKEICGQMARDIEACHSTLLWGDATEQPGDAIGARAIELARRYVAQRVAGVFFAPLEFATGKDTANQTVLGMLDEAGIPVVLIDRDIVAYPNRSSYDIVGIDNRRAMLMLVNHLVAQRETKIEFVARPLSAPTVSLRIAGYRDALREAGVEPSLRSIHFGDPADQDFVRTVIDGRLDRTFVCANDLTAARFMHTLEEIGVRVPTDVRVAGFDDVPYAPLLRVPLTTVRQPSRDIGAAAVRAMLERLAKPDIAPREIFLPTTLVLRRSTVRSPPRPP